MELKKRGLSIEGTTRVLQRRCEEALREEVDQDTNDVLGREQAHEDTNERLVVRNETTVDESRVLFKGFQGVDKAFSSLNESISEPIESFSELSESISEAESILIENSSEQEKVSKASFEQDKVNGPNLKEINAELKEQGQNLHKIYVGNFPYIMLEADLLKLFRRFGNILDIIVPRKGVKSQSFGFILFEKEESAANAIREMIGAVVGGGRIRVERAMRQVKKPSKKKRIQKKRIRMRKKTV